MASIDKRVAHVIGPAAGGMRRHVAYLALHPPSGYTTAGVWGPSELSSSFEGVSFHATGRIPHAPRGVDVIHAHGFHAGLVGFRRHEAPVVLTVHTDVDEQGATARSRSLRSLALFTARRADAVIAVSRRVAERFPRARVIAPASAPLPPASRPRDAVRADLGTGRDAVVVVSVARLHRDKALDLVVDAVASVDAEGWICGDGPLRSDLEVRARGTRVRLLGFRRDVADLLEAADVFALPSVGEAYGIAVAEAIAAGLPVVASTAGAMPEIVGDAGLLVQPGDRAAFTDALNRMVDDAELRARLVERARARRLPSPDELVAELGRVYDEVAG